MGPQGISDRPGPRWTAWSLLPTVREKCVRPSAAGWQFRRNAGRKALPAFRHLRHIRQSFPLPRRAAESARRDPESLEAFELRQPAFVDDHIVADDPNIVATLNTALGHSAA